MTTLSKNSSFCSEVFQSTQHFLSQLLLRCEQFRYNFGANLFYFQIFCQNRVNGWLSQTKFFCYHSNSQFAVTERERMHTIDVFITTWGGGASVTLHRPWGLHGLPENAGPTWKQFFPLRYTLHKPVATSDEFWGPFFPSSARNLMLISCSSCWSLSILTMLENGVPQKTNARSLAFS